VRLPQAHAGDPYAFSMPESRGFVRSLEYHPFARIERRVAAEVTRYSLEFTILSKGLQSSYKLEVDE